MFSRGTSFIVQENLQVSTDLETWQLDVNVFRLGREKSACVEFETFLKIAFSLSEDSLFGDKDEDRSHPEAGKTWLPDICTSYQDPESV